MHKYFIIMLIIIFPIIIMNGIFDGDTHPIKPIHVSPLGKWELKYENDFSLLLSSIA